MEPGPLTTGSAYMSATSSLAATSRGARRSRLSSAALAWKPVKVEGRIFCEAYQGVSGLCQTVRGPSATPVSSSATSCGVLRLSFAQSFKVPPSTYSVTRYWRPSNSPMSYTVTICG